jgi:hypothetical protein
MSISIDTNTITKPKENNETHMHDQKKASSEVAHLNKIT